MTVAFTLAQLATWVPGAVVYGPEQTQVNHITEDSRRVGQGSLFVARSGERSDGRSFIETAISRGAKAVLCEVQSSVGAEPRIEVPDLMWAWGTLAQQLAGNPSKRLKLVGITGTNGKTTVASLVAQALKGLGKLSALGGTLGFFVGEERLADSLTTPMPDQLASLLEQAVARGAEYAVMEVSSHALSQRRVAGLEFAVTAWTNLSQDHLDYHGTIEAYGAEKARLFSEYTNRGRVFNLDDAWGKVLHDRYASAGPGPQDLHLQGVSTVNPAASIFSDDVQHSSHGLSVTVQTRSGKYALHSPLLGKHNLENLLVAWGILVELGFSDLEIAPALSSARAVEGRLERCESEIDDLVVVVDYAHTPDALARVLATLSDLGFSEVSCVFGCGGDRDRSKRPLMAQAVAERADRIFATLDNPRTEASAQIMSDIMPGLVGARRPAQVNLDRRESIREAIVSARAGGCVLIAGKGHENYQIIGTEVLPFDDRIEARAALVLRRSLGSSGEDS